MTINSRMRRASLSVKSNSCLKSLWTELDQLATLHLPTLLPWLEAGIYVGWWVLGGLFYALTIFFFFFRWF